MGAGDRFQFGYNKDMLGLAVIYSNFSYRYNVSIIFLCWHVSLGLGKSYLD